MSTSLAVLIQSATKKHRFTAHIADTQRVFLCSETKSAPLTKTLRADLHKYEFYQPSPAFCRALVIDIDHIFAPNYVFDLPREIYPHAVVFTSQGVQAFWLIEGVPLTSKAHRAPIRFAQDVAELLRCACAGDPAVNALTPSKCRNPLYEGAEVVYPADCPPYALKALSVALRAFLRASEPLEGIEARPRRSEPVWGELEAGQRNETIFQTIRRTAYRGGDFEAQAYELNALCNPPLPLSEVAGIVRSVEKFMREKYAPKTGVQGREPAPELVQELLDEVLAGRVDAVTFTAAPAVVAFLDAARARGDFEAVVERFGAGVVAGSVGPVTSEPLVAAGIVPVAPERFRLGALVKEVTAVLAAGEFIGGKGV